MRSGPPRDSGVGQLRNAQSASIPFKKPPATLYMKGRPRGVSLELFYDFKLETKGEPYENVLCRYGRASSKYRDRSFEWIWEGGGAVGNRDVSPASARIFQTTAGAGVCDV